MPVYGISTKKVDERLDPWVNTYYAVVPDLDSAKALGELIGQAETSIHSSLVNIDLAHCWRVGNAGVDFGDITIDLPGTLSATQALPPWFTAEVNFTANGSYPGWKRYRTRVSGSFYEGPDWADAYLLILETFCEVWDELTYKFTTRSGVQFTGMDPNPYPVPLQLSKQWYNRTTP